MAFVKGQPKSGGRKKGKGNKFTQFKDALLEAFNSKEINSVAGLVSWAKLPENRGMCYQLMAKMLPKEIEISQDVGIGLADRLKSAREFRSRHVKELRAPAADPVIAKDKILQLPSGDGTVKH
jgi:hypothetical protein